MDRGSDLASVKHRNRLLAQTCAAQPHDAAVAPHTGLGIHTTTTCSRVEHHAASPHLSEGGGRRGDLPAGGGGAVWSSSACP